MLTNQVMIRHFSIKSRCLFKKNIMSTWINQYRLAQQAVVASLEDQEWPEGKEDTGYSPSPQSRALQTPESIIPPSHAKIQMDWSSIVKGKKKQEPLRAMSTGKSSSSSLEKPDYQPLKALSPMKRMLNSPDQQQPKRTFGKKTPELKELNSNGVTSNSNAKDVNRSTEEIPPIGTWSGKTLKAVILLQFQRRSEFNITGLCEQSLLTMQNRLDWSELVGYSGVQLELASQGELGNLRDWTLTLKTPVQNGGVDILAMRLLLSMNFEVQSTSVTSCVGWTVIQSQWKLKAGLSL